MTEETDGGATLRSTLPAPLKRTARRSAQFLQYARIAVSELLLPKNCFVQNNPNFNEMLGFFPNAREQIREYNLHYSRGKAKFVVDGVRFLQLRLLLRHAADLDEGHYAELGTHLGYSARILFNSLADGAELHCFDTFEGFSDDDIQAERGKTGVLASSDQFANTSLEQARLHITGHRKSDRLKMHKGVFPETFAGLEALRWRFVHLDADLYAPMLAALDRFYDRVVPGGVILMHDYNNKYSGVKVAADEFFARDGVVPVPLSDKGGSAVVIEAARPQSRGAVTSLRAPRAA